MNDPSLRREMRQTMLARLSQWYSSDECKVIMAAPAPTRLDVTCHRAVNETAFVRHVWNWFPNNSTVTLLLGLSWSFISMSILQTPSVETVVSVWILRGDCLVNCCFQGQELAVFLLRDKYIKHISSNMFCKIVLMLIQSACIPLFMMVINWNNVR